MLARTFILFGIISATADAAASPIFHPHQGCGLECCSGDWTDVLECPAGWTTYNGKCYKVAGQTTAKWSEARTACESEGAFLVTINDAAENAFVHNLCGNNECWIGGNDIMVEAGTSTDASAWQWHNGETSGYANFADDEPNDWGREWWHSWVSGGVRTGEDCLHMKSDGKWNDESCAIAGHNDGAALGLWDGREISYTCEKLPTQSESKTCTRSPNGPFRVWHKSITHSHHRCFLDTDEPNGCRCMCADMAFDGTESKAPTHCSTLEGDKTIKTFDTYTDWITGTWTARDGNIAHADDAYAAHCRPTWNQWGDTGLFSDHEKVRMVVTFHPATVTSSAMHAPKWGSENSWTITGQCSPGESYYYRNGNCGDSYSSSSTGQQRQHNFVLGVGTHDLVIKDSYGDGWHGGYLTLAYEDGTQFLSTQDAGFGQNPDVPGWHYECNDDLDDGYCYKKTISFTVEPIHGSTLTPTLVTENLKCDWESPFINIDNTGFDQHSIAALNIATNFKEMGHKDSDDSYKVWITACTGLDGGGSCAEHLVHAVYDDTAATAVFHDSIDGGRGERTCKLGWTAYNGKCYKMGGSSAQWGAARTACEAEGAFLVTVNSIEENTWVHDLCGGGDCWIGGNDLSNERGNSVGGWQWHNGESNGYHNFANGEPNDDGWNNGEDCIHISSWTNGQWNDNGCGIAGNNNEGGAQYSYVCEMTPVGVNIGEAHKSYKVRVETNAAGEDNMYFINSVKVNAVCASI